MIDKLKSGARRLFLAALIVWAAFGGLLALAPPSALDDADASLFELTPELNARNFVSPGRVIAEADGPTELRLKTVRGGAHYEARIAGERRLFDAFTAAEKALLTEKEAVALATAAALIEVDAGLATARRIEGADGVSLWRVALNDAAGVEIDIDALTGAVAARRDRASRRRLAVNHVNAALLSPAAGSWRLAALITTGAAGFAWAGAALWQRRRKQTGK